MRLTDEQRAAVTHEEHVCLVACPGSGKTRSIAAKLLQCISPLRESPFRVACITYTNAAVYEIEDRIRTLGMAGDEDYCDVSTIHAFCQNNILRHFYWRLDKFHGGYSVLSPDSEEYVSYVNDVMRDHNLKPYARNQFELLNRTKTGEPITQSNIPAEAAIDFWERLEADGYVDFCNIVYFSYLLLERFSSIGRNLAARYPYILVDEFQDTSDLQVEILRLIAAHGRSTFFVVGDPEQSIFAFAGARRDLMDSFANGLAAKPFSLTGNFRSSSPIVACAERLIARKPEMKAVGAAAKFRESPAHYQVETYFSGITDYFLPAIEELDIRLGDCAVLAQSWFDLLPLGRQLRQYGVPIVGPGARPYKRRHLIAGLAEQICHYIDTRNPDQIPRIERELFFTLQNATGQADFRVFRFEGRCLVFELLEIAGQHRDASRQAIEWLTSVARSFSDKLVEREFLPADLVTCLPESASAIVEELRVNKDVDAPNLSISDLGVFANPRENLKLLTMHSAKGREFQAVALLSLHDGQIPFHNSYNPLTAEGLEESRRLFYVAITRAERLLQMFTLANGKRPPSRFLGEIGCL